MKDSSIGAGPHQALSVGGCHTPGGAAEKMDGSVGARPMKGGSDGVVLRLGMSSNVGAPATAN
jgi:hypothetical protein